MILITVFEKTVRVEIPGHRVLNFKTSRLIVRKSAARAAVYHEADAQGWKPGIDIKKPARFSAPLEQVVIVNRKRRREI